MTRLELFQFIQEKFSVSPDYPWEDNTSAVFRHPVNRKWFGLVMDMKDHEYLNVKTSPFLIEDLLHESGFLPAYRMNKRHWITVILDQADENLTRRLIEESWNLIKPKRRPQKNPVFQIRHPEPSDLNQLSWIESASFPAGEAADRNRIYGRIKAFPRCLWILEYGGQIVSFVSGMTSSLRDISDEMLAEPALFDPEGRWLMLFSVVTHPDHRRKGYAEKLMDSVINECRESCSGIVLTCKESLLEFYGKFGFMDEGISPSNHGGATWHQMRLTF